MRLLHTKTLLFEEFMEESRLPKYAILSHTWGVDEVSYQHLRNGRSRNVERMVGFNKIRFACAESSARGLQYCWVDTCCIDKSSSAELSEAINSMFRWYERSEICFAFLSDVEVHDGRPAQLKSSRWFTRGWTLQELIAPSRVLFYGRSWMYFGERRNLADKLSLITGIDLGILQGRSQLKEFCVARRMSWAANRETTRIEDQAYSLMGIFDVNMPLLYGEGKKAFLRLQEYIIQISSDDSILAWDYHDGEIPGDDMIFAPSPSNFQHCKEFVKCRPPAWTDTLEVTTMGVRFKTHYIGESALRELSRGEPHPSLVEAALLNCYSESSPAERYALRIQMYKSEESGARGYSVHPQGLHSGTRDTRLVLVDRHGGLSAVTTGTHLLTRLHLVEEFRFRFHIVFEPPDRFEVVEHRCPENDQAPPDCRGSSWAVSAKEYHPKILVLCLRVRDKQADSPPFTLLCDYQRDDIPPHNGDDGDYGICLWDEGDPWAMQYFHETRYDGRTPRRRSRTLLISPTSLVIAHCNLSDFEGRTMFVQVNGYHPEKVPKPSKDCVRIDTPSPDPPPLLQTERGRTPRNTRYAKIS